MTILNVEVILRDNVLFFRKIRSCEISGKWEIGKWSREERYEREKSKVVYSVSVPVSVWSLE